MPLRKGVRLHFPCERCGKKFERYGRSRICADCLVRIMKGVYRKNKHASKIKCRQK